MKKLVLVAAVAVLTMTSCKKNYTCECTVTSGGVVLETTDVTIKDTKSKAKDACSAKVTSTAGATETCAIK